jgi:Holliday junction resolvase-like predicted endonuclease
VVELNARLGGKLEYVLMDGPYPIPGISLKQRPVISGDQISKSIAAASILAKVTRDHWMEEQAGQFPEFGFEKNKGYGTSQHLAALEKWGPTRLHRLSFLKKIENLQMGKLAEERAREFLKGLQYSIVECNWRSRWGEIDIIASKKNELHFFEVRYRKSAADFDFAFPPSKQEQVKKTISYYVSRIEEKKYDSIHADLIFVTPQKIEPYWDVFKF